VGDQVGPPHQHRLHSDRLQLELLLPPLLLRQAVGPFGLQGLQAQPSLLHLLVLGESGPLAGFGLLDCEGVEDDISQVGST